MILFACYMMRKLKNCGIGILGNNDNEIFCTDQQLITPPFVLVLNNIKYFTLQKMKNWYIDL